jgi:hypothetical protein
MRLPEAKEPFCEVMNRAYPEFSESMSRYKEFGAQNFDLQTDIVRCIENASNKEQLICSYMAVAIESSQKHVSTSSYYEGSWDLIHPIWASEKKYGRIIYRKTANWETTDLVCNLAMQHIPDQERLFSMHTDSEENGRVIVEGTLLHNSAASELTKKQHDIVSHIIASVATLTLVEVEPLR